MKPRSSLIASAVVMVTVEETDDNHADWKWDFPKIRVQYSGVLLFRVLY